MHDGDHTLTHAKDGLELIALVLVQALVQLKRRGEAVVQLPLKSHKEVAVVVLLVGSCSAAEQGLRLKRASEAECQGGKGARGLPLRELCLQLLDAHFEGGDEGRVLANGGLHLLTAAASAEAAIGTLGGRA